MKLLTAVLLTMIVCGSPLLRAADEERPFFVQLFGAERFPDVDAVEQGLLRSPLVKKIFISRASSQCVELAGIFSGKEEELRADLTGIIVDRFRMESTTHTTEGVRFTLRKLH